MYPKETELPEYRNLKRLKLDQQFETVVVEEDPLVDHAEEFKKIFKPMKVKEFIIPKLKDLISRS